MAEPLLSSLCRICNTNPPKYRCPRCSSQTCSLACSKRHKVWSDCNGVRDPTVYKPRHELATPRGIDHDYNFLSSIERGIERTDNLIVEERGLVDRRDLLRDQENGLRNARHRGGGGTLLAKLLNRSGVTVDRAPKGMKRNRDNGTNWSKNQKCINWQVEWVREDGSRVLAKVLENHPIGEAYAGLLKEERRANMTEAERKQDKKRKADEIRTRDGEAKIAKVDIGHDMLTQRSTLPNPESSARDLVLPQSTEGAHDDTALATDTEHLLLLPGDSYEASSGCYFYLHRPYTPSSNPRVLIPLHPSAPLSVLLRSRVVLEFPTIYVLSSPASSLPDCFMLEQDYLARQTLERYQSSHDEEDTDMEEGEIA